MRAAGVAGRSWVSLVPSGARQAPSLGVGPPKVDRRTRGPRGDCGPDRDAGDIGDPQRLQTAGEHAAVLQAWAEAGPGVRSLPPGTVLTAAPARRVQPADR